MRFHYKKHISSYYIHFYINHFLPQLCLLVQCSSKHLLQLYVVKRLFDLLIFIFLFAQSLRVVKVGMVVNVQSSNTLWFTVAHTATHIYKNVKCVEQTKERKRKACIQSIIPTPSPCCSSVDGQDKTYVRKCSPHPVFRVGVLLVDPYLMP